MFLSNSRKYLFGMKTGDVLRYPIRFVFILVCSVNLTENGSI